MLQLPRRRSCPRALQVPVALLPLPKHQPPCKELQASPPLLRRCFRQAQGTAKEAPSPPGRLHLVLWHGVGPLLLHWQGDFGAPNLRTGVSAEVAWLPPCVNGATAGGAGRPGDSVANASSTREHVATDSTAHSTSARPRLRATRHPAVRGAQRGGVRPLIACPGGHGGREPSPSLSG